MKLKKIDVCNYSGATHDTLTKTLQDILTKRRDMYVQQYAH